MDLATISSACSYKARLLSKVCIVTGIPVTASGNAHLLALRFSGFVETESWTLASRIRIWRKSFN